MLCLLVQEETKLFSFSFYMTASEPKNTAEHLLALTFQTF